jgi:cell wall-associated NlpC family hydrolase
VATASTIVKAAAHIASALDGKEEESKTGLILIWAIGGTLGFIVLIIAAVVTIVTAPFQWADSALQQFQTNYSSVVSGSTDSGSSSSGSVFTKEGGYTQEEINQMVDQINVSAERKAILRTALSLVGRVSYFWGGKSSAIGWDDRWGVPTKVTATGSSTTGTTIPFGLDCTGFVDWVMKNAGVETYPALYMYTYGKHISADELIPGDLVFVSDNSANGVCHIGIYCGKNEKGKRMYIHCAYGGGGVVLNSYSGFDLFAQLHIGGE